jgi:hypothetical protein
MLYYLYMKINKKSINYGLKILAILAFALIFVPFNKAAAAYGTNITYQTNDYNGAPIENPKPTVDSINPKSSNVGVGTKTITITGSGFVPSSVARVNGSNRPTTFIDDSHLLVQINGNDTSAYRTNGGFFITVFNGLPGGGYSNAAFFTVNNTTVSPVANTNNNPSTTDFTDTNTNNSYNNANSASTDYTDTNQNGNLASAAIFGSNSFLPSGLIQWILFAIIILLIIILARKIFGAREKYNALPMKYE